MKQESSAKTVATDSEFTIKQTVVSGHTYSISNRYDFTGCRILGRGSYGVVSQAIDTVTQEVLAIKRIRPYASDLWDARHTLREIRLMKLLSAHPNIITLYELTLFEEKMELYMVMELMDCDLHHIIQSKQPLTEMHYKCFARQMLEGVRAMHSIGVFHRDLKPGNLLVSKDCQLRITDFGLARYMDQETLEGNNSEIPLTEYVVTRWYRCPELLLSPNKPYTGAIDIWSVGCIMAELIRRKPLFPGKNHANQVQLIFDVFGFSSVTELGFPVSKETASYLEKRCKGTGFEMWDILPEASPDAVAFISALIDINPSHRATAAQALDLPYLMDGEVLWDYSSIRIEPPHPNLFRFESVKLGIEELKSEILAEVAAGAVSAFAHAPPPEEGLVECDGTDSSPHGEIQRRKSTRRSLNEDSTSRGSFTNLMAADTSSQPEPLPAKVNAAAKAEALAKQREDSLIAIKASRDRADSSGSTGAGQGRGSTGSRGSESSTGSRSLASTALNIFRRLRA